MRLCATLQKHEFLTWGAVLQPKFFSRPRRQEPFTNQTLHAFQRKPNKQHDIYNLPYTGNPKNKRPTSGPDRRTQRLLKMKKRSHAHELKAGLKALGY